MVIETYYNNGLSVAVFIIYLLKKVLRLLLDRQKAANKNMHIYFLYFFFI